MEAITNHLQVLYRMELWGIMDRIALIKSHLQSLRTVSGVENTFLAQRDGYPITSVGVWLRPDEIFGVSSAASAIFAVARRLHKNLKHALVEGERAKFLIVAFPGDPRYFLTLTTLPQVNLGSLLLHAGHCARNIHPYLEGDEFLPPLRSYDTIHAKNILRGFDTTSPTSPKDRALPAHTYALTEKSVTSLHQLLDDFNRMVRSVHHAFISLTGGYPVASAGLADPQTSNLCAFTYALYDTCRKVAWLTKRMRVDQVTIDLDGEYHFIYGAGPGLFSALLDKSRIKLGYLRLIIPSFIARIEEILLKSSQPAPGFQTTSHAPTLQLSPPPLDDFFRLLSVARLHS